MSIEQPAAAGSNQNELWSFVEDRYLPLDRRSLQESLARHLEFSQAKTRYTAQEFDWYKAAAYSVRDRLMERWNDTQQAYYHAHAKRIYYLSLEFLLGRLLRSNLLALGIEDVMSDVLAANGFSLEQITCHEPDAGLGNGGLGRLAACFLDSLATLQLPCCGYGIRYDYGIFEQRIVDGWQLEHPDNWLRSGYPWEIVRPEYQYPVQFGGTVRREVLPDGEPVAIWHGGEQVIALAYDIPVAGYRSETVNTLRLWSAKASQALNLRAFNQGEYMNAMHERVVSETISSVLYPEDDIPPGRELRLRQEYFFVSATIQDILRRHRAQYPTLRNLAEKVAIQLNDTHPALTIVELLRILVDEERIAWGEAWEIACACCAYTNHTIMPEALELWPVSLLGRLLPRHLELIYEANQRLLDQVRRRWPGDEERVRRMSLIQEAPEKAVRMANLALAGSHKVNGVSRLHTELLKQGLFRDFHELWPDRLTCKTNGITPRRWLKLCNPELSSLISSRIGEGWLTDLDRLARLWPLAEDAEFRAAWREVHQEKKRQLAAYVRHALAIEVDERSLFDCQVKRFHEYKRQLLQVLHIIAAALRIRSGRAGASDRQVPRTFFFAGKAAPGYAMAKLVIKLVHSTAAWIDAQPEVSRVLRVAFLPNYGVSLAQLIIPAADLSTQISTAGREASGTSNMKFALNGALIIGTRDGATIEIAEEVGEENIFLFGLTAEQIEQRRRQGADPLEPYLQDAELRAVLHLLNDGELSPGQPGLFRPLIEGLLNGGDPFFVLADFRPFLDCQGRVDAAFLDPEGWTRRSIRNTAKMGRFSSDRSIRDYAEEIWQVSAVPPMRKAERRFLSG